MPEGAHIILASVLRQHIAGACSGTCLNVGFPFDCIHDLHVFMSLPQLVPTKKKKPSTVDPEPTNRAHLRINIL